MLAAASLPSPRDTASTMSQENVEVVRRSLDAFNRGDLEGVRETLAPGFEMHPSGRFMDTQRLYRGQEGWTEFWGDFEPHGRTSR